MNSLRTHLSTWTLTLLFSLVGPALAQGTPSGEYGQVGIGQPISGVMTAATDEQIVFHTYVVTVAAGTPNLTIKLSGDGADLDLAVKFGTPILDYNDVDHLDTSDEPNPSYTVIDPPAGVIYIDVLNLVPQAAAYQLNVTVGAAAANPFSPTTDALDPFIGTFEGEGLSVTVTGGSGQYQGQLVLDGQSFPFVASSGGELMEGTFQSGGQSYPFVATLQGEILYVESGGGLYATVRSGDAVAPPPPSNPLGGNGATVPNPNDPVIAQGSYGTLTQDNALAFIEALEFSLQQVGYTSTFSAADRQQLLQALTQNYAQGEPSDQAVLAQARLVWNQVQNNWTVASDADKRQFIIGVFILAFGPEAVQQAMGTGGGGAGAAGGGVCNDIDTCISAYSDPEAYQDTVNAQSCWAAAGCSDYDPGSNDFTYEPSYDYE